MSPPSASQGNPRSNKDNEGNGGDASPEQEPAAKKVKPTTTTSHPKNKKKGAGAPAAAAALQTNLFAFFASNVPTPPKKRKTNDVAANMEATKSQVHTTEDDSLAVSAPNTNSTAGTTNKGNDHAANSISPAPANKDSSVSRPSTSSTTTTTDAIPAPKIPTPTPTPRTITWQSYHDNFVLVRQPAPRPLFSRPSASTANDGSPPRRTKVAAIDLDGTLVVWRCPGFPNSLSHYELWNTNVPTKLRHLYDDEGYQIVLISNQAAIQSAHTGKKAQLVQNVMNWIAALVDRPVYAVISTQSSKKTGSFHKPNPELWKVAQKRFGGGGSGTGTGTGTVGQEEAWDIASSFFVGDSADPNDPQGGVDAQFAKNVGDLYGTPLKFYTPTEFFGPSDYERRQRQRELQHGISGGVPAPAAALQARSALLGGYSSSLDDEKRPILLLLCGVQGSGKSTFCEFLLLSQSSESSKRHEQQQQQQQQQQQLPRKWVHLSQDTIQNGKPGRREQVEDAARVALQEGKSVVIDRMHLTAEQRNHFVQIGVDESVPVHVIVLNPSRSVIAKRVRERTDHPGKVQGEDGVRRALQSLDQQFILPTYTTEPEITLISCASTPAAVSRLARLYADVPISHQENSTRTTVTLPLTVVGTEAAAGTASSFEFPTVALGTMGIGKRIAVETIGLAFSNGFCAIDTAPTYHNLEKVGEGLSRLPVKEDSNTQAMMCIAKIPKNVVQPYQVRDALTSTLEQLQRSSVDLLLLHWPCDVMAAGTLVDVWKEMEACCREGQCKALGVCNFNVASLCQLLAHVSIPPVVNQVERHPLLAQWELVDFCERHHIHLQAHTPLGQGSDELLENAVVQEVAKETQTSPAAVVLQWNIQQGVSVVPKCRTEAHLKDVFRRKPLIPEQMKRLDSLDCGKRFVAPPFMYGSAPYCWK